MCHVRNRYVIFSVSIMYFIDAHTIAQADPYHYTEEYMNAYVPGHVPKAGLQPHIGGHSPQSTATPDMSSQETAEFIIEHVADIGWLTLIKFLLSTFVVLMGWNLSRDFMEV